MDTGKKIREVTVATHIGLWDLQLYCCPVTIQIPYADALNTFVSLATTSLKLVSYTLTMTTEYFTHIQL
jgi:hypothetical protein